MASRRLRRRSSPPPPHWPFTVLIVVYMAALAFAALWIATGGIARWQ